MTAAMPASARALTSDETELVELPRRTIDAAGRTLSVEIADLLPLATGWTSDGGSFMA